MSQVRSQGRPPRGPAQVGRPTLIALARIAFRKKPRIEIQRQEIAAVVGVTPALLTYYFRDKWSLIEAAAEPVVLKYDRCVQSIANGSLIPSHKLFYIVALMLHSFVRRGYLTEYYRETARRENRAECLAILAGTECAIVQVIQDVIRSGPCATYPPQLYLHLLDALCKERSNTITQDGAVDPDEGTIEAEVNKIYDVIVKCLSTPDVRIDNAKLCFFAETSLFREFVGEDFSASAGNSFSSSRDNRIVCRGNDSNVPIVAPQMDSIDGVR